MFGILNKTSHEYVKVETYFELEMNQIKLEKIFNKETNKYEIISVKSKLELENCKSENFYKSIEL